MSQDQEWLVRLQFLEEAQEYISTMESSLLGLSSEGISPEGYNSILRAAHSIKGGSALMGFAEMSQVAHRLEDFFKVLRAGHRTEAVDASLEQIFFNVLDCMGQMSALYRQQQAVTPEWLAAHPQPFLDTLYQRLGDPSPEDDIADLSADAGEDMISIMFSSEVEPCLDRIAEILADPTRPLLKEEFILAGEEMAGLGEMLELPAFSGLCYQVIAALETAEGESLVAIAQAALDELQRVQALVVMGELALLPTQLNLPVSSTTHQHQSNDPPATIPAETSLPTTIASDMAIPDIGNFQLDSAALEQMRDLAAHIPELPFPDEQPVLDPFHEHPPLSSAQYSAIARETAILTQSTDVQTPEDQTSHDSDTTLPPTEAFQSAEVRSEPAITSNAEEARSTPQPALSSNPAIPEKDLTDQLFDQARSKASSPEPRLPDESILDAIPARGAEVEDSTVRVSVKQLERLGELFGELNTERGGLSLRLSSLKSLVSLLNNRVTSLNNANEKLRQSYDSNATTPASSSEASPSQPLSHHDSLAHRLSYPNSLSHPVTDAGPFKTISSGPEELDAVNQEPVNQESVNQEPVNQEPIIDLDPISLAQQFDLLEMDQYSDLHLIAQEIIERVVQIQEVSTDIELALGETEGISRELGRTAKQMQIGMTQVRMRPLSDLTRRFPRLLRQLSLHHGKFVQLKERGTGTLIERSILEALQDPLMHLLRNSFDHGIETPDIRQAYGKPSEGVIEISASYRGNQTLITIRDDGGGIDIEKIKAKVVNTMGLSLAEVNAASEQEILDLIFEPGFSTADTVTDLSGRGGGMDVVRSNLEAIQGSVQVETEPGQGTTFTLTVPLSLSVTRVLVVECQGLFLAFPTSLVEEMLLLNRGQVRTVAEREIIEWQGYTVPLLRLEQWLNFNRPPTKLETESTPIIDEAGALLVSQGDTPYAIHCDRYWGEQEVTTRLVEGSIPLPQGFSGCVVLGDGRVVPLAETESLLDWILTQQQRAAQAGSPETQPNNQTKNQPENQPPFDPETTLSLPAQAFEDKPTVMIVDDSINVRRFLAITLEKAGYRVEQAKDGQDALDKLQEGIPVDAVISDVEMPRMDGFRFLARLRSVEARKQTPIIMLTSRSGNKHRRLANQLGASDYFSKPFKQNELLSRLSELIQPRLDAELTGI